ncbi:hypothetical protein BGW80DRAFT_1290006 [Lactifluus volemus]|nr:hypothetical protein BGW80DRAFT_1290006 [Lactifluus volemus]
MVVPETIPAGYHGRSNDQVQDVPEWPAFDFGHAYLLCRGACYVLSFQAKSAPRLVYLMVQAQPRGGRPFRLSGHCHLGQTPIRYVHLRDGAHQTFVRLGTAISSRWVRSEPFWRNHDFCDILDASGIETITLLDLLPKNMTGSPCRRRPPMEPGTLWITFFPPHPPDSPGSGPPPTWHGSLPSGTTGMFEANRAGRWHATARGDTSSP